MYVSAVYHVTKDGWKKVSGTDVGELHFEYYPKPVRAALYPMLMALLCMLRWSPANVACCELCCATECEPCERIAIFCREITLHGGQIHLAPILKIITGGNMG
jgi:hypothetical protein